MEKTGKNILLAITGGIAAYKIPWLVRLFTQAGHEVQVIATQAALDFVSEKTLAVLTGNPVINTFYKPDNTWNNHVKLGIWADVMVVAPATANTMAKMVQGQSDNLLLATYLSARCPVVVFPAMDLDMWQHPSTQKNVSALRSYGNHVVEPASGALASGLEGKGRMPEPEAMFLYIKELLYPGRWQGKKVLITAGPTYEPIDPVRFLGNRSSGKMGYALAAAFSEAGAQVTVVSGPVAIQPPKGVRVIRVESAQDMLDQASPIFAEADLTFFAAAVADYRVAHPAEKKMKRQDHKETSLALVANPDIAKTLSSQKKKGQYCIGFALETHAGAEEAKAKMQRKGLDAIVLNLEQQAEGSVFGSEKNEVLLLSDNNQWKSGLENKTKIAQHLENKIYDWFFA